MKELFKFGGEIDIKKSTIIGVIGSILLVFVWWCIVQTGWISPKILPNPIDVVTSVPTMISKNRLLNNLWITVSLNLSGYFWALIIALPIAFLIGCFPVIRGMFQKPFEALRALPLPAIISLWVSIWGFEYTMKSTFLALGILVFLIPEIVQRINDLQNHLHPDNVMLQTGKTLGLNNFQLFIKIYVPYVMASVYSSARTLIAISYGYCTICESVSRSGGVGSLITIMSRQSNTPAVYALLMIIILVCVLQDYILRWLEPIIFPYKKK